MGVLSDGQIRQEAPVSPLLEKFRVGGMSAGLSHCGYDVRCEQTLLIPPGGFILASTVEKFDMPEDVVGIVHDKSTWARLGLCVQNTVIEPGWRGWLTLELKNNHPSWMRWMPRWMFPDAWITVEEHSPIAQVIFHRIEQLPESVYSGKYQDQARGPVAAVLEAE